MLYHYHIHTQPKEKEMHDTNHSPSVRSLGITQLAIMSVIRKHPNQAYGTAIANLVSKDLNKEVSDAQVFVTLGRLERHGLVEPDIKNPEPTGARGRPKKMYQLTASGKRALEQVVSTLNSLNPVRMPNERNSNGIQIPNGVFA